MNHTRKILTLLCLLAVGFCSLGLANASDSIPGGPQKQPIALVGGMVHPVSSAAIENGIVLFEKGKLVAVGENLRLPSGTKKIDVTGKHVYPGLFEAYTKMGLVETSSVRATRDYQETGRINPNALSHVAVNPDSEIIPVTRSNGVLLALTSPSGGLISGQSAVLQMDGWTYEDLTLLSHAGMHINWPSVSSAVDGKTGGTVDRVSSVDSLRELFEEARNYQAARATDSQTQPYDIRLEAMAAVLAGRQPIVVSANSLATIQSAVAFAAEQNIRLIIFGGYDAPLCASLLKKHQVPVIVSSIHRTPPGARRSDDYDAPYTLPERLRQANVKFCISGWDRSKTWNSRNLPYQAATAAAYGLPKEEALKSITLYPAQILGVGDRVGSLEAGKDATLFVSDGDPLETATQIERAFIQGRTVDLTDRHKRLYHKYQQKYKQQ